MMIMLSLDISAFTTSLPYECSFKFFLRKKRAANFSTNGGGGVFLWNWQAATAIIQECEYTQNMQQRKKRKKTEALLSQSSSPSSQCYYFYPNRLNPYVLR
ncbi:hypothetical protein, unlikely [Trypanosoma brucei gambiense DAL972]|uniref:Uncharacterized protein n=1 Tax=Trypanosoma brucei gambiense (strain MHOM/CI/86/DAL972) TaxID=679716 RepID=C9ZJA1_TRYB9|nr:hypothetical protein, unlikely [Trypanosoma brucei gambiense DAL972]CBH09460.1 hypothetical protein, unlikely [Trypanosoma brucei gambiense DAL972]|eukprot:XP_011771765.1 hypothetical protein, unlikely [Trypanosoma brucei gambiense DAL972]